MNSDLELEELIEHFTVIPEEMRLIGNKYGGKRLGFAVSIKFIQYQGRFPKGKQEISAEIIQYVAKQVGVPVDSFQEYDWDGRTIKYHRAQIRDYMGFRECTSENMEQIKSWLQANILPQELQTHRIRENVLLTSDNYTLSPQLMNNSSEILNQPFTNMKNIYHNLFS